MNTFVRIRCPFLPYFLLIFAPPKSVGWYLPLCSFLPPQHVPNHKATNQGNERTKFYCAPARLKFCIQTFKKQQSEQSKLLFFIGPIRTLFFQCLHYPFLHLVKVASVLKKSHSYFSFAFFVSSFFHQAYRTEYFRWYLPPLSSCNPVLKIFHLCSLGGADINKTYGSEPSRYVLIHPKNFCRNEKVCRW